MLEGLDAIEWATLTHAYGSADDVPDLLRDLASDDLAQRESALWHLYGNIYHQGTVYEATAYAVPFIVEILTTPTTDKKYEILNLLSALAGGSSYLDAHQAFEWEQQKAKSDPEGFRAQLEKEWGWVHAARQAVYAYHERYIELLAHEDPKTRATAAYLLASFREHHEPLLPVLYQQVTRETETESESAVLLALGYLAPPAHEETIAVVAPYLAPDYALLTRWAASMTMARLLKTAVPESALTLLVKVMQSGETIANLDLHLREIPWWEGGALGSTCTTLTWTGKARIAPFLPQILEALPDIVRIGMDGVVRALLTLLFDGQRAADSLTLNDLDTFQIRTLKAIAEHALEFETEAGQKAFNGNVMWTLRSFNLPNTKEKLDAFLKGA